MAEDAAYRQAVDFAVRAFAAHPQASLAHGPRFDVDGALAAVDVDLGFGRRWVVAGGSPTGVRPIERVELGFPPDFPRSSVVVSLRPDFSRDHPHIQPRLTATGRVEPCVVDGQLAEFLAADGFAGLAVQTVAWLENAAQGRLIDAGVGWEPARRDNISDVLVADEDSLRALAAEKGGFQFFRTDYHCEWDVVNIGDGFFGNLGDRTSVKAELSERRPSTSARYAQGQGLAVIVWAEPDRKTPPKIVDTYLPDDVETVEQLWRRAADYGVEAPLRHAAGLLQGRARKREGGDFPLLVIMLVRRPRPLIGGDSPIEILAYLTPFHLPGGALSRDDDVVRPVGVASALSSTVLRRLSGAPAGPVWALLGAGSLGSKVALHLARSAAPPCLIVDKGALSPHNVARHGLYPENRGQLTSGLSGAKADAVANVLRTMEAETTGTRGDHFTLAEALEPMRGARRPAWIVNTTASLVAREALSAPDQAHLPRQIEMSLYGASRLGLMAIEGPTRNPNALELATQLYQDAADRPDLGEVLFAQSGVGRVSIGQGCGSLTTVMSDAAVSIMGAQFSELFAELAVDAPAETILLRRHAAGLNIERRPSDAFLRVPIDGLAGWTLSVAEPVRAQIHREAAAHRRTETGGVLVGRASALARTIVVTDLIAAPPDSQRSPMLFTLGTRGLPEAAAEVRRRSRGLLDVVGTWHSHLGSAQPSQTDRTSAGVVGASAATPMAFLITGTDGWRAIPAVPPAPQSGA